MHRTPASSRASSATEHCCESPFAHDTYRHNDIYTFLYTDTHHTSASIRAPSATEQRCVSSLTRV